MIWFHCGISLRWQKKQLQLDRQSLWHLKYFQYFPVILLLFSSRALSAFVADLPWQYRSAAQSKSQSRSERSGVLVPCCTEALQQGSQDATKRSKGMQCTWYDSGFFSLWSLCCTDVELASKDKIWIPVQGFSLSSKSLKCARLCCAQSSIGIADERWITEFRAANRISPFFIYILVGTLILFRGKSMRFHEWKPFDHCHFQGLAEAIWAGTELSRLFRVVKFLWQCMVPFTAIDRTKWHHDIHVHLPKVKDMNQKRELLAELLEARNPSAGWSWSYDVMLIIYILELFTNINQ